MHVDRGTIDMKHVKQDFSFNPWVGSPGWTLGWDRGQRSTFSEYGHVAYEIKGNKLYNNIQANILPLHRLDPWMGQKVKTFLFKLFSVGFLVI